jgi:hypothetical protein
MVYPVEQWDDCYASPRSPTQISKEASLAPLRERRGTCRIHHTADGELLARRHVDIEISGSVIAMRPALVDVEIMPRRDQRGPGIGQAECVSSMA